MQRKRIFPDIEKSLQVCPYQMTACDLPEDADCELAEKLRHLQDVKKWRETALTSVLCHYRGIELSVIQYNARKQGLLV